MKGPERDFISFIEKLTLFLLIWAFFFAGLVHSQQVNRTEQITEIDKPAGAVSEGEYAIEIVRDMGWQKFLPAAATTENYIELLESLGVSPLEGWDRDRILTYENYLEIASVGVGLERSLYDKSIKFCNANVDDMNSAKIDIGKASPCPWAEPYYMSGGKVKYHRHSVPLFSYGGTPEEASSDVSENQQTQKPVESQKPQDAVDQQTTKKPSTLNYNLYPLVAEEYETNIFLTSSDRKDDFKTIFNPSAELEYMNGDLYGNFRGASELVYYAYQKEWTVMAEAAPRISYYPDRGFSIGASNNFTHTEKSNIGTVVSDRILSLGYNINKFSSGVKYDVTKNFTAAVDYNMEFVDFSSTVFDDGADKKTHVISTTGTYRLNTRIFPFAQYYAKFIDFDHDNTKSATVQGVSFGAKYKIPRMVNAILSLGWEMKELAKQNDIPFQVEKNGITGGVTIYSTFSRFTSFNVSYLYQPLVESSGVDYRHYSSHYVGGGVSHRFSDDITLAVASSFESQQFNEENSFVSNVGDLNTRIATVNINVSKKVMDNMWLSGNCSRTLRISDFADDTYNDNKFTISLVATF